MKLAHYVVLENQPEGTFVFRYANDWSFAGDTWHANREDALQQIEFEFTTTQLVWEPISEEALKARTRIKQTA